MPTNTRYTISIIEDMPEVRDRLATIISAHNRFILSSVASTIQQGSQDLIDNNPDIALVDLGLPDGSGVDVIRLIFEKKLKTQALVISGFQDELNVFRALESGAQGYLYKMEEDHKIIDAIDQIIAGGSPISPVIARLMLKKFKRPQNTESMPETLTEKQLAILTHISQGFTSKEIAEKTSISYYTVTTHIKNIYAKLQVNSRAEAVYEARKIGLID